MLCSKDEGAVEPVLQCAYTNSGPSVYVYEGAPFTSFRVMEVVTEAPDLVRQTLARHRVTQMLAPHTTGAVLGRLSGPLSVRV